MSWVRRIFGEDCQWFTLFNESSGYSGNLFENSWCDFLLQKMTNTFWIDVIKDGQIHCRRQHISNDLDILNSCRWFYPKFQRKNVLL